MPAPPSLPETLPEAVRLHQSGRLDEAAALYARILEAVPLHPDALHLLGVVRAQTGRPGEAVALVAQAVALNPASVAYRTNLTKAARGDEGAVGPALLRAGDGLFDRGRPDAAAVCYRAAAAHRPDDPVAWGNLAQALRNAGRAAEALVPMGRASRLDPDDRQVAALLGGLHFALGDLPAAEAVYRALVASRPDDPASRLGQADVVKCAGRFEEAMALYRRTLGLEPANATAFFNLGVTASDLALGRAAIENFGRAAMLAPDHVDARFNLGCQMLAAGNWEHGWREFEWRLRRGVPVPDRGEARWTGEPLEGRSIRLYAEQGHGDGIQFIRYAPLVAARGGRVLVECPAPLVTLFETVDGVHSVHPLGEAPDADFQCPLMSLPHVFGTRLESLPARVPYVKADPARVAHWRARMDGGTELRVGLVWAGNAQFRGDHLRSPGLAVLRPLLDVPGVRFFGLQVGEGRGDLDRVPVPDGLCDLGGEVTDFADTAAVMASLDLVIASCTGSAHLAGALGVPVWVLLAYAPDWRWMHGREDSPWYPTARLFRQRRYGDWAVGAARAAAALAEEAAARSR